jgi:hypothetical protein
MVPEERAEGRRKEVARLGGALVAFVTAITKREPSRTPPDLLVRVAHTVDTAVITVL